MHQLTRPVYAIILAAGESRRCAPRNKLFLPFGVGTVLEASVGTILASRVDGVAVILGHQADRASQLLESLPCRIVYNPRYPSGMGSSVIAGIDYWLGRGDLASEAGFLFALGDQPCIPPDVINEVIRTYRKKGTKIVVPVCNGRRGHPSIFHRQYADEIREVAGRWGAREVLRRHPDDIVCVEVAAKTILLDIDTPDDYISMVNPGR